MERTIVYFEKPGPSNTEETLRLAVDYARRREIGKILVASTQGDAARRAAGHVRATGIKLVVVPHQHGFSEAQLFPADLADELRQEGHVVHFGTMLFHTGPLYGSGTAEALAMVLRTVCQGMKVAVETVMMAADGGHLAAGEEVVVVSGTRRGADTAVVALAATSQRLHDLHITEILCKPLQTRSWAKGTSPYDAIARRRAGRPATGEADEY
jgi:uncharacterized protein